jgi:hypothetical protein
MHYLNSVPQRIGRKKTHQRRSKGKPENKLTVVDTERRRFCKVVWEGKRERESVGGRERERQGGVFVRLYGKGKERERVGGERERRQRRL